MHGMPCKATTLLPKHPSVGYALMNLGTGCGDLGADGSSHEADSVSETAFLASNGGNANLTAALTDLG